MSNVARLRFCGRPPRFYVSCGAGLRQPRLDIVIHTEEICGIVFILDLDQARQIVAEGCVDDLLDFNVERAKKMRVRGKRPKEFFAGLCPSAVYHRFRRLADR